VKVLNQVLAIEKGTRARVQDGVTKIYQKLDASSKPISGSSRTYRSISEDGERFSPETTVVTTIVAKELDEANKLWAELFDISYVRDVTNCEAFADVVVDGQVLFTKAPVTFLLFLEKKLKDIHLVFSKLPTLDPANTWTWDENKGCYVTPPSESSRPKKVARPFVKYEATVQHPAQVEVVTEDVIIGYWTTIQFSGAMPNDKARRLLARVEALQRAVKVAREEANMTKITTTQKVGDAILNYLNG